MATSKSEQVLTANILTCHLPAQLSANILNLNYLSCTHVCLHYQGHCSRPIMERIIEVGQRYVDVSDKSRDAAAYVLARFMTRPDVKRKKLPEFLDWCLSRLKSADSEQKPFQNPHKAPVDSPQTRHVLFYVLDKTMSGVLSSSGVMSTLALLFKHGKRDDLLEYGQYRKHTVTKTV